MYFEPNKLFYTVLFRESIDEFLPMLPNSLYQI